MGLQFVYISIGILTLLTNIVLTVWLIRNSKNSRSRIHSHSSEIINFRLPGKAQEPIAPTEILSEDNTYSAADTEIL